MFSSHNSQFNLLGASNKGAGNTQFSLHSAGQILAQLVLLVGNAKVGDHLLVLLLQPPTNPGPLAVLSLQLRVEPEVLRDSEPGGVYSMEYGVIGENY